MTSSGAFFTSNVTLREESYVIIAHGRFYADEVGTIFKYDVARAIRRDVRPSPPDTVEVSLKGYLSTVAISLGVIGIIHCLL